MLSGLNNLSVSKQQNQTITGTESPSVSTTSSNAVTIQPTKEYSQPTQSVKHEVPADIQQPMVQQPSVKEPTVKQSDIKQSAVEQSAIKQSVPEHVAVKNAEDKEHDVVSIRL